MPAQSSSALRGRPIVKGFYEKRISNVRYVPIQRRRSARSSAFIYRMLFTPDSGTARADFSGGSAKALW